MTCLRPNCGKERILDNLPVKHSEAETKLCARKYSTSENHKEAGAINMQISEERGPLICK